MYHSSFTQCGVPENFPPEMLLNVGQALGGVDSWQLGLLLFEMYTGRHPFVGLTITQTFRNILNAHNQVLRSDLECDLLQSF